MASYLNLNGNSGINEYDIGIDYIVVHFKNGKERHYRYDYATTGAAKVEEMKKLAKQGFGLNSYINTSVKKNFASKW